MVLEKSDLADASDVAYLPLFLTYEDLLSKAHNKGWARMDELTLVHLDSVAKYNVFLNKGKGMVQVGRSFLVQQHILIHSLNLYILTHVFLVILPFFPSAFSILSFSYILI